MAEKTSGIIKDWAATISKLSSKPSNTTGSSCTLSSFTCSATNQATSQHSTTSMKKAIVPPVLPNDDIESIGPLSDHDETVGNERDAAINSPAKNGACTTSSVSTTGLSLIYYKYANSPHIRA